MKRRGAYGAASSLARQGFPVELLIFVPWLLLALPAHARSRSEPEPRAQLQIPRNANFYEAEQLLAKQKWAEAAIVLRSVLKEEPANTRAAMGLARALVYSGRREEALMVLSQVSERESRAARTALQRRIRLLSRLFISNTSFQTYQDGVNLMVSRKYRPAREKFDQALEQEPDNVEILTRLGQALALEGNHDSAVEKLRLARRLNPHEPEIRLWLGNSMHQRGELAEALVELKAAAQSAELKDSELGAIWYAEALYANGQKALALHVLEENAKNRPEHLSTLLASARLRIGSDSRSLWAARRDLQLVYSRLPQYPGAETHRLLDRLGVELRLTSGEIRERADKLIQQVEEKLKSPAEVG
jgi:tetratricopeptide (TPR) repeat protein